VHNSTKSAGPCPFKVAIASLKAVIPKDKKADIW
jgi:hypothetical protein